MSKTAVRSPLTQGGLEIKCEMTIEWQDKDKFLLLKLKEYICKNYNFEKSLDDDSEDILEDINKVMQSGPADSELDEEMDQELPILMEEN